MPKQLIKWQSDTLGDAGDALYAVRGILKQGVHSVHYFVTRRLLPPVSNAPAGTLRWHRASFQTYRSMSQARKAAEVLEQERRGRQMNNKGTEWLIHHRVLALQELMIGLSPDERLKVFERVAEGYCTKCGGPVGANSYYSCSRDE